MRREDPPMRLRFAAFYWLFVLVGLAPLIDQAWRRLR